MTRYRIGRLDLTLKGHDPREAEAIARDLPGAIARALDAPHEMGAGPADDLARRIADGLSKRGGME